MRLKGKFYMSVVRQTQLYVGQLTRKQIEEEDEKIVGCD